MRLRYAISTLGVLLVGANGCSSGGPAPGSASTGTGNGGTTGSGTTGSSPAASAPDAASPFEGGASSTLTGVDGALDSSPSPQCANPTHTLALDPSNAQNGVTLSGFYVDADTWNVANYSVSQTMYICDYYNWYAIANMNNDSGDGAVKTYPDVHEDFDSAPAISSFATITSTFAHTAPHVGIYEFAYDIWLNGVATNGSTEVMIWTDNYNQVPSGSKMETVTLDGQSYDVFKDGSYIAFVETQNVASGTVKLLSFFNHIIMKGWVPSTSTLGAVDYGVELVSTGGMDATFRLDDFSLTTN